MGYVVKMSMLERIAKSVGESGKIVKTLLSLDYV